MNLNKVNIYALFGLTFLLFLLTAASKVTTSSGYEITDNQVIFKRYNPSKELIFNPERGHYVHYSARNHNSSALTLARLDSIRDQDKISLVLTIYYLGEFMEGPVSAKMLQLIETNMTNLRKSGLKCILRFAYKSNREDEPWDPTPEIVVGHISQLKPVLQKNGDVIAAMEAGFIGVWGEWYYSSHFGYPGPDIDKRKEVLIALMDALPADRMICLRTPIFKMRLSDNSISDFLTEKNAYNQSQIARLGHHNDCFLASQNDYGTYKDLKDEKEYLEKDSRFVVVGGETCNPSTFAECANAMVELRRFHWSYLNRDYHKEVLNGWKVNNCYNEIVRKLGYRLTLLEGMYDIYSGIDWGIYMELTIVNEGYAAPYNPRNAEIIMEHEWGFTFKTTPDIDPRFWLPGKHVIRTVIRPPTDAPEGKYTASLKLAPPEESLYDNPYYSIRLANEEMWDEDTGNNILINFEIYKRSKILEKEIIY